MHVIFCLLALVLTVFTALKAQTPVASFTVNSTACRNQFQDIINQSSNASSFEWDFCPRDSKTLTNNFVHSNLPGLSGGYGYKLAQDQGQWYAFVTSQLNHSIYRLDFGASPTNTPVVTNMGNPQGLLSYPHGLEIVKAGTDWFGFITNYDPNYGVVRLDFGSSLLNLPTAQNIGMFGVSGRYWDVKVVAQGTDMVMLLPNRNNNSMVRVNFRNSFDNPVAGFVTELTVPGSDFPVGIDAVLTSNGWRVVLASYNSGQLQQLDFGGDILGTITNITSFSFSGIIHPVRVKIVAEGTEYSIAVSNDGAAMTVVDFKNITASNPPTELSHPSLPSLAGIDLFRQGGKTFMQGVGLTDNTMRELWFEESCSASIALSLQAEPQGVYYSLGGNNQIELTAQGSSSSRSVTSSNVAVSGSISPDIAFVTDGKICAGNSVNFTSINNSGNISVYHWDFDDASVPGVGSTVSHSFMPGNFNIRLDVTASNGCANFAKNPVTIFSQPSASFILPSPSISCTNQIYSFINSSSFDAASNPSWQWSINGIPSSSAKDLAQSFSTSANQSIQLSASIPGCSSQSTQNFLIQQPGPVVDFTMGAGCLSSPVPFTNLTSGTGITYAWSFGDGNTSSQTNPSNVYSTLGSFLATLTTLAPNGCQNSNSKSLIIYSNPQPDFSAGLPPFSCSNSPTQFQNNTPPLTDSNIITWNWQFGDGGTSTQAVPVHTYASANTYPAVLTAISDKGCSGSVNKSIVISPSPTADFTVGPACLNLSTKFTDISSGGVQSRLWQIGSSTFTIPNPSYTFTVAGSYFATLTATSANGCISVKTKTVAVPVAPAVDFFVSNLCAGKNTTFTDATSSPQDAVVGWNWNFAGNASTGNPASYSFAPQGTYNVKLTTTHLSGCKYTLSKNIVINPSPIASFTANPDRGSAPLIVQFNNISQQSTQYAWKFYDKVTTTSANVSPAYTFVSLGDYSAELTASNSFGCDDKLTVPIKVLVPSIDLIMKDFQLATDPLTGKIKSVITIFNNSNIPITSAEVALFLADKSVVNETLAINLAPGQSATRSLSFTLSSSQFDFTFLCAEVLSDKDIQSDNNKRCINLEESVYIFSPYPNPSSGEFHLDWITPNGGDPVLIIIYDSIGKKTYEWQTSSKEGLNQTIHDLTFLTAGLYFVTIEIDGSQKTTRFLRQ